ncbi:xaa-pro dipeptidase [Culex quinquefasciatus]|uniref:Xaa-pro dipeptidase n=1 Tax=Culex quinquefasciatus TaxID=7176 RepID=B0XCC7_CULQU|nr:xaa-pro dipeptidase [Culex quinquefasciatus]|eukprot:XP_001867299.1 xaa-pro dipeptidase [Culex quinquefasciatus]
MACYQMGPNTHSIPMTLFRENRDRVMAELRKVPALEGKQALVVLQGGDNISLYDTDVDYVFRQFVSYK